MKPSEVKIGDVFFVTMNKANGVVPKTGDTSRDKFFVVLGFDNDGNVYGGVIFNSFINMNLPPNVRAMQHLIKGESYDFLSYDSYIDCSSIKIVKKNKLLKSTSLGTLDEEDISLVCGKTKSNSRINKAELKRFGLIDK